MGNKMPLLKPREVIARLEALGFKHKRTKGDHAHYELEADGTRERAVVTVQLSIDTCSKKLMKSMIGQSKFSQEEFCTGKANRPQAAPAPIPKPAGGK